MFLPVSIVLPGHLTNLTCANTLLSVKIRTDLLYIWEGWTARAHGWWGCWHSTLPKWPAFNSSVLSGQCEMVPYINSYGQVQWARMAQAKTSTLQIGRVEARGYIHWGWSLGGFFPALLIWPHKQQPLRNKSRISCRTCPRRKFGLSLWALGGCLWNCTTTAIPFKWPSMVRALQHTRFIQSPFLDINKK